MSALSPLMAALLDVDRTARALMRHAGNTRQKEHLRDALHELRTSVLDIVAANAAEGRGPIDAETFRAIVHRCHELGIDWTTMVGAFNEAREEVPS